MRLLAAMRRSVRVYLAGILAALGPARYRPELNYMRGPGAKTRAKLEEAARRKSP